MPTFIPKYITHNLINIPGWRSKRKIVVIESDDWGSIRMASKEAFNHFLKIGYPVDKCAYNRNDSLESNDDLELLFEVLNSVKDKNGHPAIITANSLAANPDFDKIKADGYQKYYYEPITETFKRHPRHDRVFSLYQEGISKKVFWPQFHGREHLNVSNWMQALQRGDSHALEAFDQRMFSVHAENNPEYYNEYTDALAWHSEEQLNQQHFILTDGLNIFKNTWGYESKSFMAPCYIWSCAIDQTLEIGGVRYLQGMINQFEPKSGMPFQYKLKYHYLGQKNKFKQRYLIRNVFFEPSYLPDIDNVNESLRRIRIAFSWGKPAIISSHRLNFIGSLVSENREKNLVLLRQLLNGIITQWPDVEFMTSDEFGDILASH